MAEDAIGVDKGCVVVIGPPIEARCVRGMAEPVVDGRAEVFGVFAVGKMGALGVASTWVALSEEDRPADRMAGCGLAGVITAADTPSAPLRGGAIADGMVGTGNDKTSEDSEVDVGNVAADVGCAGARVTDASCDGAGPGLDETLSLIHI